MAWEDLNTHPRITEALYKSSLSGYTALLTSTAAELTKKTGLSARDIKELVKTVSRNVAIRSPYPVLQLLRNPTNLLDRKLATGCDYLDGFLNGGILVNRITEIAGESASGKTQLCLQLSLTTQLPEEKRGLNAGVAFICTEDSFPTTRFQQIISAFSSKHTTSKNLADNVFIQHIAEFDHLKKCLCEQLPVLLKRSKIGLIIIDSVAALFRADFDNNLTRRAEDLRWLGNCLHRFCTEYKCTVICVNQISGVPGGNYVPSLGLTWSNLVNVRLLISRTNRTLPLSSGNGSSTRTSNPGAIVLRTLEVVFAPNLPNTSCYVIVDKDGLKGLRVHE